ERAIGQGIDPFGPLRGQKKTGEQGQGAGDDIGRRGRDDACLGSTLGDEVFVFIVPVVELGGLSHQFAAVGAARRAAPRMSDRRESCNGDDAARIGANLRASWPRSARGTYFFFSVWIVCLRKRGEYFFNLSFSPPGLRRRV